MVTPAGVAVPGNDWSILDGRRPDEPPSVSIVVVHYEQQAELDRTLLALSRQDHPAAKLEIIVVDDGSEQAPVVPAGVKLIVQEDRGFRVSAARNAGAAAATGDILCFLDADTAPERSYVRELTRLPALAPDVVTVGLRRHADLSALEPDAVVDESAVAVELTAPVWLGDAYAASRNLLDADDRSYRFVLGAVVACDRLFFAETGGFDESFSSYGGEDWEWAYRAWLRGAVLAHVPTAVAWHDGPEWADRDEATLTRKNAEAMLLGNLIPLPGSGFRGLPGRHADIAVTLPSQADDARDPARSAWFVTRDTIASELPRAALPGDDRELGRCRLRVDVKRPLRVADGALRGVAERVAADGLSQFAVVDADDRELAVVVALRAEHRAQRWGRQDLFPSARDQVPGLEALPDVVDVEAYLGGWG